MTSFEQPPDRPTGSSSETGPAGFADQEPVQGLDPAQRSLADALRVSFNILKFFMVILVIVYLASGVFRVDEQYRAVRLRLGEIIGDVYEPGWHFGLPYPVEEIVRVKITTQELAVTKEFWHEVKADDTRTRDEMAQEAGRPLNPLKDGSLLTGDANIVHAKYKVSYSISADDTKDYVENIGDATLAQRVVLVAVERGIVHAVASVEADNFLGGRANQRIAKNRAQDILDELKTGIEIQTFAASMTAIPLPVYQSWHAVSNAESRKGQLIEQARIDAAKTLGETAGEARDGLKQLVREYEEALVLDDQALSDKLGTELNDAFDNLRMDPQRTGAHIGGLVAELMNDAITYRTQTVQTVEADANRFKQLYDKYLSTPVILVNRQWQQMRQDILSGDVETLYMPTENLWIEMNPDPIVEREREKRRIEDQAAKQRKQEALDRERMMATNPSQAPPPGGR